MKASLRPFREMASCCERKAVSLIVRGRFSFCLTKRTKRSKSLKGLKV